MRRLSFLLMACLMMPPALAEENSPFGSAWEPRPLVNTDAPSQSIPSVTPAPSPTTEAQKTEEMLKPVEPFIAAVEKQLGVVISPEASHLQPTRSERLNHVQDILFGARVYDDAGDLLARLTEIFPHEAAQAQARLQAELRETVLKPDIAPAMASGKSKGFGQPRKTGKKKSRDKDNNSDVLPQFGPLSQPAITVSTFQSPQPNSFGPPYDGQAMQSYQPSYNNQAYERREARGETFKSLGRGLMNLAMMGGSLAGSYYLNKNMGGNEASMLPNANPYGYPSNNPYYGSPYNAYPSTTRYSPGRAQTYYGSGYGSGNTYYSSPYSTSPYGYGGFYGGRSLLNGLL